MIHNKIFSGEVILMHFDDKLSTEGSLEVVPLNKVLTHVQDSDRLVFAATAEGVKLLVSLDRGQITELNRGLEHWLTGKQL